MRIRPMWCPRLTHRTQICVALTSGTSVASRDSSKPRKSGTRRFLVRLSSTLIIYQYITSTSSNARQLNANNDLKRNNRCRITREASTLAVRASRESTSSTSPSIRISWSRMSTRKNLSKKRSILGHCNSLWSPSPRRKFCGKS